MEVIQIFLKLIVRVKILTFRFWCSQTLNSKCWRQPWSCWKSRKLKIVRPMTQPCSCHTSTKEEKWGGGYGSLFLSRWWKTKSLRDTHLKPMLSLWQTKTFLVNVLVKGSTKFSIKGILSSIMSPIKLSQHFGA